MRVLIPGVRLRRRVRERLEAFYAQYQDPDFDEAVRLLSEFYKLPLPKIRWYEKINNGRILGLTEENGTISLTHPEDFKRMQAGKTFQPTCAQWVGVVLHEWAHYLWHIEEERKADLYARKFVTGLA